MKMSRTRIARTIAERTLKQGASKQYAREIAAYLLSERRTHELDSTLRDIQDDWAQNGHVEATTSSAHSLTPLVKKEIAAKVKKVYSNAKEVVVNEIHDPTIIGGVRVSLPSQQLDLTVQGKLNKFKQLTTTGKV